MVRELSGCSAKIKISLLKNIYTAETASREAPCTHLSIKKCTYE